MDIWVSRISLCWIRPRDAVSWNCWSLATWVSLIQLFPSFTAKSFVTNLSVNIDVHEDESNEWNDPVNNKVHIDQVDFDVGWVQSQLSRFYLLQDKNILFISLKCNFDRLSKILLFDIYLVMIAVYHCWWCWSLLPDEKNWLVVPETLADCRGQRRQQ